MAAMRAPALCSLRKFEIENETKFYYVSDSFSYEYDDCEPGWITAYRSKTTNFCHYVSLTQKNKTEI